MATAGNRLLLGESMDAPETVAHEAGTAVVFNAPAPGEGRVNEDSAGILPCGDSLFLVVADGVGGHPGGADASRLCVRRMADVLGDEADDGAILRALDAANEAIVSDHPGAATTVAVAEIRDGCVRSYHVGDSEIVVTGNRGRLRLHTVPHSPAGYALAAGTADHDTVLGHPERHLLSNAMGTRDMRIEVGSSLRMNPRDTVVVASDGLFDNLTVPEVCEVVRSGPIERAAGALRQQAAGRMAGEIPGPSKPDDLTFVVFRPAARARSG